MAFTRQHYRAIAAVLKDRTYHNASDPTYAEGWHAATSAITHELARIFESDNPRFDRAKFLAACGVNHA